MKKRLFSVLTCLALCLSLLPTAALAVEVDQTVYVGGVELTTTADNSVVYAKTSTDGTVTAEGASAGNYSIVWDGETLTLKGAEISGGDNGISREGSLQLVLEGTNTISGYATGDRRSHRQQRFREQWFAGGLCHDLCSICCLRYLRHRQS